MPFKGDLISKKVGIRKRELWQTFSYTNREGIEYTIPKGFSCDGASIPKVFWSLIGSPFTGRYAKAAWLHDWLYRTQPVSRQEADLLFIEAMKELGVSWLKRKAMHRFVRIFGWLPWRKYRREIMSRGKCE